MRNPFFPQGNGTRPLLTVYLHHLWDYSAFLLGLRWMWKVTYILMQPRYLKWEAEFQDRTYVRLRYSSCEVGWCPAAEVGEFGCLHSWREQKVATLLWEGATLSIRGLRSELHQHWNTAALALKTGESGGSGMSGRSTMLQQRR